MLRPREIALKKEIERSGGGVFHAAAGPATHALESPDRSICFLAPAHRAFGSAGQRPGRAAAARGRSVGARLPADERSLPCLRAPAFGACGQPRRDSPPRCGRSTPLASSRPRTPQAPPASCPAGLHAHRYVMRLRCARKAAVKAETKERAAVARAARQGAGNGLQWQWWRLWPILLLASSLGRLFTPTPSTTSPPPPSWTPRTAAPAPIRPPEGLLGDVLQKACKRGILPPRDERTNPGRPLDEGRLLIGEATRRLLAIPDDVNVFQENGELVLRRKPAMKRLPSLPPLEPTAPSK